jgi:hypothetical protein
MQVSRLKYVTFRTEENIPRAQELEGPQGEALSTLTLTLSLQCKGITVLCHSEQSENPALL